MGVVLVLLKPLGDTTSKQPRGDVVNALPCIPGCLYIGQDLRDVGHILRHGVDFSVWQGLDERVLMKANEPLLEHSLLAASFLGDGQSHLAVHHEMPLQGCIVT